MRDGGVMLAAENASDLHQRSLSFLLCEIHRNLARYGDRPPTRTHAEVLGAKVKRAGNEPLDGHNLARMGLYHVKRRDASRLHAKKKLHRNLRAVNLFLRPVSDTKQWQRVSDINHT